MLGSLGKIIFECAEGHVLNFSDLTFNRSANYAEHKIIGSTGLLEFTGINAASCSIKMTFDTALGINPAEQVTELERMMNEHEAVDFILDGLPVGTGLWVIESLSESYERIDASGSAHRVSVTANLKEYREL